MKSTKPKAAPGNRGRKGPGGCAICRHDKRPAVDLQLTYGTSARSVAEQYGLAYDAVLRHQKNHLTPAQRAAILTASKPSEVDVEQLTRSESAGLLAHLIAMRARLASHATACTNVGDFKGAIRAEQVTLADLELTAKLVGTLISRSEVVTKSFLLEPDYVRLRTVLIEELRPHPEIACRVAARIAALENDAVTEIAAKASRSPAMLIEHQHQATA